MRPRYELVNNGAITKNSCAATTGTVFTVLYIVQQMIFLFLIYVSMTHQVILLFSLFTWFLSTLQVIVNVLIGLLMWCGYHLDYASWCRFKSFVNPAMLLQMITHIGTPSILLALRLLSTEDEQKALYESLLMIFGLLMVLDTLTFSLSVCPYFAVYSEKTMAHRTYH